MRNPHTHKAHEFIRKKILTGEFKPGYRLKTKELTEMVGISATPIRDALRLLESDGLVEILPRLGASVKSFDVVSFKELSEVRCALECLAAELAAHNRSDAELAEIEGALNEMGRIVEQDAELDPPSREALRTADIRFHIAILVAAHNQTLYAEVLRLQVVHRINSPMTRGTTVPQQMDTVTWKHSVYKSHKSIFNAIRDRDGDQARMAMKEHIQGIIDRAVLAMAKSLQGNNLNKIVTENIGFIE